MHWKAAVAQMERAFPLFRELGFVGAVLDFMDRDDQEMVHFFRRALKMAADNLLMVTLHDVGEPSGLEQTFPNLLKSEAELNRAYDKWDELGVPPEHELTVPFTRMLAGPLDFDRSSLRGLPADYPSSSRGPPALLVLVSIPTTWDDTRCLSGAVGEQVVIPLRRRNEWWDGAITARKARDSALKLDFLEAGLRAESYRDDLTDPCRMALQTVVMTAGETFRASLAPAGGKLVRLSPESVARPR